MDLDENNFGYSDTVMDHFTNPRNVLRETESEYDASGIGMVGNPTCGDMMKVWIKVNENERITDLKWKTFGCASAIGSTSMMSEMVTENGGGKTAADIDQLVEKHFLEPGVDHQEYNLNFVRDRLTQHNEHTRELLQTYRRIAKGKTVLDDTLSPIHTELKLSGARTPAQ